MVQRAGQPDRGPQVLEAGLVAQADPGEAEVEPGAGGARCPAGRRPGRRPAPGRTTARPARTRPRSRPGCPAARTRARGRRPGPAAPARPGRAPRPPGAGRVADHRLIREASSSARPVSTGSGPATSTAGVGPPAVERVASAWRQPVPRRGGDAAASARDSARGSGGGRAGGGRRPPAWWTSRAGSPPPTPAASTRVQLRRRPRQLHGGGPARAGTAPVSGLQCRPLAGTSAARRPDEPPAARSSRWTTETRPAPAGPAAAGSPGPARRPDGGRDRSPRGSAS